MEVAEDSFKESVADRRSMSALVRTMELFPFALSADNDYYQNSYYIMEGRILLWRGRQVSCASGHFFLSLNVARTFTEAEKPLDIKMIVFV